METIVAIIGATFVVIAFAILAHFVRLVPFSQEVMIRARGSFAILRDPALDDDAKEIELRKDALRLFALLGLLLGGSAIALLSPIGVIWLLDSAGWISFTGVLEMLQRWDFLLVATVIGFAAYFLMRRIGS